MMISRYNMRIKNNDKTYFRAVCIVLFSLAFTGCTKDGLNEFGPGNATGKVVMVSLNVSLPPIEEPTSTSENTTVKPFLRNENSSDSSFTVVLEREQRAATTRVSDGTTKLHNLWLFQFNEDGSINYNGISWFLFDDITVNGDEAHKEMLQFYVFEMKGDKSMPSDSDKGDSPSGKIQTMLILRGNWYPNGKTEGLGYDVVK